MTQIIEYDVIIPLEAWAIVASHTVDTHAELRDHLSICASETCLVLKRHHEQLDKLQRVCKAFAEAVKFSENYYSSIIIRSTSRQLPILSEPRRQRVVSALIDASKANESFTDYLMANLPALPNLLRLTSVSPIDPSIPVTTRNDLIKRIRWAISATFKEQARPINTIVWKKPSTVVDLIRAHNVRLHLNSLSISDNFSARSLTTVANWPALDTAFVHANRSANDVGIIAALARDRKPVLHNVIFSGTSLGSLLFDFCYSSFATIRTLRLGPDSAGPTTRLPVMPQLRTLHCDVMALNNLLIFQQPSLLTIHLLGFDEDLFVDHQRRNDFIVALRDNIEFILDQSRAPLLSTVLLQNMTRVDVRHPSWHDSEMVIWNNLADRLSDGEIEFLDKSGQLIIQEDEPEDEDFNDNVLVPQID